MSSKLLLTRATVQDGGNDPYILAELSFFFCFCFSFTGVGVSGGFGLRILNSTLSYGMSTLELDFGFISNYSLSLLLSRLVFSGPYVTGVGFLIMLQQSCWNT
jgi:hypothetical protein